MATAMRRALGVSAAIATIVSCHARPVTKTDAGADAGVVDVTITTADAGHKLGSYYPDPILDIGSSTGQINVGTLQWPSSQASATITQASTSGATGANLTVCQPQASTATNGTPGLCVVNLPAPTGTGSFAGLVVQQAGTQFLKIAKGGPNANHYSLWLGDTTGQGSAGTDWSLSNQSGGALLINAPTTSLQFSIAGGATALYVDPNGTQLVGAGSPGFGGGVGVIGIANATTTPTTNVAGKGQFYASQAGGNSELFWRDSAGNVYQITPPAPVPSTTTFTSSGTFSPTVTGSYLEIGCGGGGGGGGGAGGTNALNRGSGGGGGGGAQLKMYVGSFTGGNNYTVTIGGGGAGGSGGASGAVGSPGNNGTDTTITTDGLNQAWPGAMRGFGGSHSGDGAAPGIGLGGAPNRNAIFLSTFTGINIALLQPPGYGGSSSLPGNSTSNGSDSEESINTAGYSGAIGGTAGANSNGFGGGGGGGGGSLTAGTQAGVGGAGGASGANGSSAPAGPSANTCSGGGGGGGGGGTSTTNGGAGSNGASGKLVMVGPI